MEKFNLFWKNFRTISAPGQVSNKIPNKIYLIWKISKQYGMVAFILESLRTLSVSGQVSNKILDKINLIWNIYRQYGKVSFFLEKFLGTIPDKFLDKICFRTKPKIFPDSKKKFHLLWKVYVTKYFPNNLLEKNVRKKYVSGQNLNYFQIVWKLFI